MTHLLVVDDNPDNRKLVVWLLEDEDIAYTEAASAEEAFGILDTGEFDGILMDISLPGMQGDDATRKLRADSKFDDTPIIALTAHAIKGEKEKIMASGVDALLTKPIDEDQFWVVIRQHILSKAS